MKQNAAPAGPGPLRQARPTSGSELPDKWAEGEAGGTARPRPSPRGGTRSPPAPPPPPARQSPRVASRTRG